MLNVSRLIKGSIAAVAVAAGGATAMTVVSNAQGEPTVSISTNSSRMLQHSNSTQRAPSRRRAPYVATAPELTNNAPQSTVNRFRLEFADPSENILDNAWGPAPNQTFTIAADVKCDRLPMTRTLAVLHGRRRLIDGDYPFATIGWQRSLAAANPATTRTMPSTD